MKRPSLNELFESSAPVICASCYLGGERFAGDAVCPNTARVMLQGVKTTFDKATDGYPDDETVSLEVFGDSLEDRETVETTISSVREGVDGALAIVTEKASKCAANVGRHVINGANGLRPLETFTRVELSNLSRPK